MGRKRYKRNCLNCELYYQGEGEKFCSSKCSFRYRSKNTILIRIDKVCIKCNKNFKVETSAKNQKYCSSNCSSNSKKIIKLKYPEFRDRSTSRTKYFIMKSRALKKKFEICSGNEFVDWFNSQEKICTYCGIPEEIWQHIYNGHQNKYSLTIDRMDNSKGYIVNNLTLACSQCNSSKNDVFSYIEMKEIGMKYLKPKWQLKIKSANNQEVCFGRI